MDSTALYCCSIVTVIGGCILIFELKANGQFVNLRAITCLERLSPTWAASQLVINGSRMTSFNPYRHTFVGSGVAPDIVSEVSWYNPIRNLYPRFFLSKPDTALGRLFRLFFIITAL